MEPTSPLREAARILWRHKGKMALFFSVVLTAVALFLLFSPRTYRSEAKLLIRLGRENVTLDPTATIGQPSVVTVPQSRENEINSVIEILKSRPLLDQVVDAVGPGAIFGHEPPREPGPGAPPPEQDQDCVDSITPASGMAPSTPSAEHEEALRAMQKALNVEAVKHSDIILITYDGSSPELARAVVARLAEFYLERHLALNRTPGAHQFLAEQAGRLRNQLTQAEEELRDLKTRTGLAAPEVQRQLILTRIGRLEDELAQATTSLAATEAEVRALKDRLGVLEPTQTTGRTKGLPNVAVDGMRGQLYALQLKEQELLAKHPDKHPEVQLTRQQVAAAKAILAREESEREQITVGPNRVYEDVQMALFRQEPLVAALRARATVLRGQLDCERARVQSLTDNQMRITRLQREVELHEIDYRKYASSLEQTQLDRALEQEKISNVRVVQPATADRKPVRPRVLITLCFGFAFALAGAIGMAVLAEQWGRQHGRREIGDGVSPPASKQSPVGHI